MCQFVSMRVTSKAGLTLGSDHGCSLSDSAESLSKVLASADEGGLVGVLVNVEGRVGGGEDLRPGGGKLISVDSGIAGGGDSLVDVVNTELLEDLALNKVSNTGLGHDLAE
jgi:hypothetical protein